MERFVTGQAQGQATLFPERLEDCIAEGNPVRVIHVFFEELDLRERGFTRVDPLATGRPAYHPVALRHVYIYRLCWSRHVSVQGAGRGAVQTR